MIAAAVVLTTTILNMAGTHTQTPSGIQYQEFMALSKEQRMVRFAGLDPIGALANHGKVVVSFEHRAHPFARRRFIVRDQHAPLSVRQRRPPWRAPGTERAGSPSLLRLR